MTYIRDLHVLGLAPILGLATAVPALGAQDSIPVRSLSAVQATSTHSFANVFSVRALSDGRLLVNDGVRRQLVLLDARLSRPRVVLDSVAVGGQGYGPTSSPSLRYLGDSTLFVDGASLSLVVLDPSGRIARVQSAPKPGDLRYVAGALSGIDAVGNLVYQTLPRLTGMGRAQPGQLSRNGDSATIVRANFAQRTVDTLARFRSSFANTSRTTLNAAGQPKITIFENPLVTMDEWAVLSDGTIAIVRGHDYHVDFLYPDGTRWSSAKLPFAWKRLTEADKEALLDSARAARAAKGAGGANERSGMSAAPGSGAPVQVLRGGLSGSGAGTPSPEPPSTAGSGPTFELVPATEIPDYYPPIRVGAATADMDGRLWILPTTTSGSLTGELVYDVVDRRGRLLQRVRVPVGRSIVGFGANGVVYLRRKESANAWLVERASVVDDIRSDTK